MNKKSQAAMEFLMTYGWAILAAIIAIGVLAYMGVFSPLNPNNYQIYKCHNETTTKEICELKSDICDWSYHPRTEKCIYYKKIKTQREVCEEVFLNDLEFCKKGKISNNKCLISFEKDDENCEENCIGKGNYLAITKIEVIDLNDESLGEHCELIEESFNNKKYRCGEYLVKGGN